MQEENKKKKYFTLPPWIYIFIVALLAVISVLMVILIFTISNSNQSPAEPAQVSFTESTPESSRNGGNISNLSWRSEDDLHLTSGGDEVTATVVLMVETTDGEAFDINTLKFYSDDPSYISIKPDFWGVDFVVCKVTASLPYGEEGREAHLFASTVDDYLRVTNSINVYTGYFSYYKPRSILEIEEEKNGPSAYDYKVLQ